MGSRLIVLVGLLDELELVALLESLTHQASFHLSFSRMYDRTELRRFKKQTEGLAKMPIFNRQTLNESSTRCGP